jgi:hypothetical protein
VAAGFVLAGVAAAALPPCRALLLVTDHYPTGAAAQSLAKRVWISRPRGPTIVAHRRTLPAYGPVFGFWCSRERMG